MGGYMLYDECRPLEVLSPKKVMELARLDVIDFPVITEREIRDRSKGDLLSKTLVVVQTTWFIIQCCTRALEGLPLTELEIVNLVTYATWWNKPLNVDCSLRAQKKRKLQSDEHGIHEAADVAAAVKGAGGASGNKSSGPKSSSVIVRYFADSEGGDGWLFDIITLRVAPFLTMATKSYSAYRHPLRVATFSSGEERDVPLRATIISAAVATAFGAIHCIAWAFEFPSAREQFLWRIASVAITGIPLFSSLSRSSIALLTRSMTQWASNCAAQ